jgi:HAD superfamily hydrolase (TIGR01509 family)
VTALPELDTVAEEWQLALDRAADALDAAAEDLPGAELNARRHALAVERAETAHELGELARDMGVRPAPWLSPRALHPRSLGLADDVRACIFDLDGVLTDSAVLHAAAWAEVFDDLLLRRAEQTGWEFRPFERDADYRAYLDGRPRLEGIHMFLRSRGIRLPEGLPDDPADADTACGLARHKAEALGRGLRARGVNALPGARRYLEAAGRAGLGRAVVSSSTRTLPMLALANLASLVDVRVDFEAIAARELRSRPAPDIVLAACDALGISPEHAVSFTHSPDGVAAAKTAGVRVVAVAVDAPTRDRLRAFDAPRAVARLSDLLEPQLRYVAAA